MYTYKYPRPAVTADCVVITKEPEPRVLLIQRGNEPFKGQWAFPGGFMNMDETAANAAIRELKEETGLIVNQVFQLGAYTEINRDPRGRIITIAYETEINGKTDVQGGDDAAIAKWFNINRPLD